MKATMRCRKSGRRMAGGGFVGPAGTNRGSWSGDGDLGVRTGTKTGTSASNRPQGRSEPRAAAPVKKPAPPAKKAAATVKPKEKPGLSYSYKQSLAPGMSPGNYMRNPTQMPAGAVKRGGLRAGGLAKAKKK